MPAAQMELAKTLPSHGSDNEELHDRIQSTTRRGIQNLQIDCTGDRVRVSGISRSYYIKQLATHAVLSANPTLRLDNAIRVALG